MFFPSFTLEHVHVPADHLLGERGRGLDIGKMRLGPGRIFHCAMEAGGEILVFDVWESVEHFQNFGETLRPILNKLGVDLGELSLTSRGGGRCFTPSSSAARKGASEATRGERVSITEEWL